MVRKIKSHLGKVCIFLPTLFNKIIETYYCDDKHDKHRCYKIHTLVIENTPRYHQTSRKVVSLKRSHFFLYIIVFCSHCCVDIGRQVSLMLPDVMTYPKNVCI